MLHVIFFATQTKCLHVYILHGCERLPVVHRVVLDVHVLDLVVSIELFCMSLAMTMSMCFTISSPCIFNTIKMTIKEVVYVSKGNLIFGGGRLRILGHEGS